MTRATSNAIAELARAHDAVEVLNVVAHDLELQMARVDRALSQRDAHARRCRLRHERPDEHHRHDAQGAVAPKSSGDALLLENREGLGHQEARRPNGAGGQGQEGRRVAVQLVGRAFSAGADLLFG